MFIIICSIVATIQFLIIIYNLLTLPPVESVKTTHTDHYREIEILVPVRNEGEKLRITIPNLVKFSENLHQITILDDRSTDNSRDILEQITAGYKKVHILTGKELPIGWTGKNHAIHQLIERSSGKYLLLIDSDTLINDHKIIDGLLSKLIDDDLDAISVIPHQRSTNGSGSIIFPLMLLWPLSTIPLLLLQQKKNILGAIACGQFILIRKDSYLEVNSYSEHPNSIIDDVQLFRAMLSKGMSVRTLWSSGSIGNNMYGSIIEALNGFAKNFFALNHTSKFMSAVWFILYSSLLISLLFVMSDPMAFLPIIIIMLSVALINIRYNYPFFGFIFSPIYLLSMISIDIYSFFKFRKGSVIWKGREVKL